MSVKIDPAVQFYDPRPNNYDLAKDPRCLYGWGPPYKDCSHYFGHFCCRELGHRGLCDDRSDPEAADACERKRRPRNWDSELREHKNV